MNIGGVVIDEQRGRPCDQTTVAATPAELHGELLKR